MQHHDVEIPSEDVEVRGRHGVSEEGEAHGLPALTPC